MCVCVCVGNILQKRSLQITSSLEKLWSVVLIEAFDDEVGGSIVKVCVFFDEFDEDVY